MGAGGLGTPGQQGAEMRPGLQLLLLGLGRLVGRKGPGPLLIRCTP